MLILYSLLIFGVLLFFTLQTTINLLCFRRPDPQTPLPQNLPLVSILIPARNEALRLPECLDSLLAQDYSNLEWIVLDDHSTDGTADIVRERMVREPRLQIMSGETLPPNWNGKSWACHQLSQAAKGEFLLFTDADTKHSPKCAQIALATMEKNKIDLLSLWPRQITETWAEHLIVPVVHNIFMIAMPHWLRLKYRCLGAANGQFLLFRRSAYKAIGGHEHISHQLVDDVSLGREIMERGFHLRNIDGVFLIQCRMYTCASEVWEGFAKNFRAGFESSSIGFLSFLGFLLFILFFPSVAWFFAYPWNTDLGKILLGQAILVGTIRLILAIRFLQPWQTVVFHPFGILLMTAISVDSWRRTLFGKVTWKGRVYDSFRKSIK